MKLSIIVPVYNMVAGGKLEYCLNSLLSQTVEDYEIIAVDDKSTDNSLDVLREYEEKYSPQFKVIASPENKRQGGAKNLGLEIASGEWIGFVDSDDWISSDMYAKLLQKAKETGADIVGCDYLQTDTLGKEEGIPVPNNLEEQTGVLDIEKYKSLILTPGSMVIKIYRRELFFEHNLRFPEKIFYEDNAIGALPLLYAKHFERVDEALYFYYQHSGSTVHTITLDRCHDRIRAAEIFLEECKTRSFYADFKDEIDYTVFELGYCNTIFSHLQTTRIPSYRFASEMRKFLQKTVPEYADNPYYISRQDAEKKKLVKMHMKNVLLFLIYYKLLYLYRKIRYGKNS